MQEPCGVGRAGPSSSSGRGPLEQVEVGALAEVAEQQDADRPAADAARGGADPTREPVALHAGAGADRALRDLGAEGAERRLDVGGDHRARVGEIAVVALADDRQDDVVGAAPGGDDRRLKHGPDRMRPAEVDGGLHPSALVDLELRGELADAVDGRRRGRRRQLRRRDDGDAGPLSAGCLRLADPDPGNVGDRVPRAGGDRPDANRAGEIAPATAHAVDSAPSLPAAATAAGSWSRQAAR